MLREGRGVNLALVRVSVWVLTRVSVLVLAMLAMFALLLIRGCGARFSFRASSCKQYLLHFYFISCVPFL